MPLLIALPTRTVLLALASDLRDFCSSALALRAGGLRVGYHADVPACQASAASTAIDQLTGRAIALAARLRREHAQESGDSIPGAADLLDQIARHPQALSSLSGKQIHTCLSQAASDLILSALIVRKTKATPAPAGDTYNPEASHDAL